MADAPNPRASRPARVSSAPALVASASAAGACSPGLAAPGRLRRPRPTPGASLKLATTPWLAPLETAANEPPRLASTDVSEAHTAAPGREESGVERFRRALPPGHRDDPRPPPQEGRPRRHDRPPAREVSAFAPPSPPARSPRSSRPGSRPRPTSRRRADGFVYTLNVLSRQARGAPLGQRHRPRPRQLHARPRRAPRDHWETRQDVIGGPLRPGLLKLHDLRNKVAQAASASSRPSSRLQVADYADDLSTRCSP